MWADRSDLRGISPFNNHYPRRLFLSGHSLGVPRSYRIIDLWCIARWFYVTVDMSMHLKLLGENVFTSGNVIHLEVLSLLCCEYTV